MQQRLFDVYNSVREITKFSPAAAVVLGSGNAGFAELMQVERVLPYSKIPGFPVSTVSGHEGSFVLGTYNGLPVAVMNGRVHYYEGYSMAEAVLPLRLLRLMGAESVVLTNAAGSLNPNFTENSLMAIADHISSFVPSPLHGANIDALGVRFPDMTDVYDNDLRRAMKGYARQGGFELHEGIYCQLTGPQYETPAEIRMLSLLGADAVGMSTAAEAIAARHAGMRVAAISRISNMAAGMHGRPLSHNEVKVTPKEVLDRLFGLVGAALDTLAASNK